MKNKKNIEKKNIIQKIVNFIFKIYSIKSRKKEKNKGISDDIYPLW